MLKVIRDNTKELFYTICKNCGSELEYEFDDVEIKVVETSYHTDKRIICPVCGKDTMAELYTKRNYKESFFSFRQTDSLNRSLNSCVPLLRDKE